MRQQKQVAKLIIALVIAVASGVQAQQTLDRTKVPPAGEAPELRVPVWTKTTLANGAILVVSERHGLPLVSFAMTFVGGANQLEPANRRGLASITSSMLTEGTTTKTGDQLSDALQLLGTNVITNITGEQGSMGFISSTKNFSATLAILQDMILNPRF